MYIGTTYTGTVRHNYVTSGPRLVRNLSHLCIRVIMQITQFKLTVFNNERDQQQNSGKRCQNIQYFAELVQRIFKRETFKTLVFVQTKN